MLPNTVLETVISHETEFPPFTLMRALSALCVQLGEPEHPELVHALRIWFTYGCYKKLPPAFICDVHDMMDQYDRWQGDKDADERAPYVPLYELLPMGYCIQSIHGHFLYDFHGLAPEKLGVLRQQLRKNDADAYGLSVYHRSKTKVPLPEELDWEPFAFVEKFLRETPFYDFFLTQVPFRIAKEKWSEHAVIIARPGFGKSQLISSFIAEALQDPNRAIILLDPHGDLFRNVRDRVPHDRLVVIDTDNPPPLNVFDFRASSEEDAFNTFKFFLSSLAGGLSPKQDTCILPLFELIKSIEGATLLTLHDIITERPKKGAQSKFAQAIERLDDVHRDFFEHLFYSGNFQETRDSLQWKLIAALGRPAFRKMFSAPCNSIDLGRVIEGRKVLVVRGSDKALGKDGLRIFFLFLVSQYYAAGKRRDDIPEKKRHLAQMFIDEASTVLSSTVISDILVELRKYQCALILATQVWEQIAQEVKPAVLGATSIKCIGEVQYNDRVVLSRDMNTTPEFLQGCKAVKGSHANWAFYVTEMTDRAVRVRVPYGVLEDLPIIHSKFERAPALSHSLPDSPGKAQKPENAKKAIKNADAHLAGTTAEVDKDEEGFREDERNWILEDIARAEAEAEASEATIKPGRDWSEPT